ncbi:MAG: hypothetical protein HQM06_01915 [Magnetococcales bacterium]|nr:hypothetical protein [Magnetococcales bacterium]
MNILPHLTDPSITAQDPYPPWLFRDINLSTATEGQGKGSMQPDIPAFARWLFAFQKWQSQRFVAENNRYYLMLGRRVHVQLPCSWQEGAAAYLQQLAPVTARAGHALTVRMALEHALHPPAEICTLLQNKSIQKFLFNLPTPIPPQQIAPLLEMVEFLLACRVMPILLGDINNLLRSGLLHNQRLNAANFTLYPSQRHMDYCPTHPVDSCATHFSWFIDRNGDIYPCGGLSGIASCRLGTLQEGMETILQRIAQHPVLNFSQLIQSGPLLSPPDPALVNRTHIPYKCLLHRRQIQRL